MATDDLLPGDDLGGLKGFCGEENRVQGPALTQFYCWGSGVNGRLGLGTQQEATTPEMLADLDGNEVLDLACGNDHTLVLIRL